MRIYLTGFMGSGKSHTGRQLADLMGCPFYDLDDLIVSEAGCSISEIFARQGEEAFRLLEQQQLRASLQFEQAVIATGGGTPCFFDNMDWINANGLSIYLKASPKLLATRLLQETDKRPLLANLNKEGLLSFIQSKLNDRRHHYEQAQLTYEQKEENAKIAPILLELIPT